MGKYSLVAVNTMDKSEHIISVYDSEKKEIKQRVHIKDIDAYTSVFLNAEQLFCQLNNDGIIDFHQGYFYIESIYKKTVIKYTVIFDSRMIEKMAKSVQAGYINLNEMAQPVQLQQVSSNKTTEPNQKKQFVSDDVEKYRLFVARFLKKLPDEKVLSEISNSIYFVQGNKQLFLRYSNIINQLEKGTNDNELLIEEQHLRVKITEELKRYKTFRGLYLFEQEQQKFAYRSNFRQKPFHYEIAKNHNVEYEEKTMGYRDVDLYNQKYDEFLSEEEYADAYGGENADDYGEENAVQYVKGARRYD